jgi:hypothetical protein
VEYETSSDSEWEKSHDREDSDPDDTSTTHEIVDALSLHESLIVYTSRSVQAITSWLWYPSPRRVEAISSRKTMVIAGRDEYPGDRHHQA